MELAEPAFFTEVFALCRTVGLIAIGFLEFREMFL